MASAATSAARRIPRCTRIGFTPEVMYFIPSFMIASARTTAVVVPSPATSPVLLATMLTSLAPMFSKGCGSSISLETVTPSLVMRGLPKDFCRTTLRPRGPSVALTARASCDNPAAISARASTSNFICFAAIVFAPGFLTAEAQRTQRGQKDSFLCVPAALRCKSLVEHAEDVGFAQDDEFF